MNPKILTVLLVRHDVSTANLNPGVYGDVPDPVIPLVDMSSERILASARVIADLECAPEETCSWYSPYLRCQQTEASVIRHAYGRRAPAVRRRESFLMREQEFGHWDRLADGEISELYPREYAKRKQLTDARGRFYFRYPGGESRADVVQRIMLLIAKINRSRYRHHFLFLHGVTQRAFRMAWLNRSVLWFEEERNPPNASVLAIRRNAKGLWFDEYLEPAGHPIVRDIADRRRTPR